MALLCCRELLTGLAYKLIGDDHADEEEAEDDDLDIDLAVEDKCERLLCSVSLELLPRVLLPLALIWLFYEYYYSVEHANYHGFVHFDLESCHYVQK